MHAISEMGWLVAEEQSNTRNEFINANWRLVVYETGNDGLMTTVGKAHEILPKVPYNELFAD
jgi:hypothetical protein